MISLVERERRQQGITAASLAARMGTTPATISQIERGRLLPSAKLRERVAAALGVGVDDVFPSFFVLTVPGTSGLLLAGARGRVFAFRSREAAEEAGRDTDGEVHGPVPISHLAVLLGVTEIEVVESLVVDPDERLVVGGDS